MLTAVDCGWGGVGPTAVPPRVPDAWVVAVIDVQALRTLTAVRVVSLEMLDARGAVVARGTAPFDLRVAPANRRSGDFASEGTSELPATVPLHSRLRLRIHAPLDTLLQHIAAPATLRVRLSVDGGGVPLEVSVPVAGEWPTA